MLSNGNDKVHIKVKGGFSDINEIVPYSTGIQIDDFDERTRTKLNNVLFDMLNIAFSDMGSWYKFTNHQALEREYNFCKSILSDVFAEKTTKMKCDYSFDWEEIYDDYVDRIICEGDYNEVLDVIGYCCNWLHDYIVPERDVYFQIFNEVFEHESIGYRFVETIIVQITDKQEIAEIEEACNCKFDGCKSHMRKALGFLSDREHKDYKNSIKESISAVESVCQIIVGKESDSLGKAVKKIKNLHHSLEEAILKLYGYASDKGGIRHSEGQVESDVSFDEAKFILVACSAILNFLIAQSNG